jgi:hypothetical protein
MPALASSNAASNRSYGPVHDTPPGDGQDPAPLRREVIAEKSSVARPISFPKCLIRLMIAILSPLGLQDPARARAYWSQNCASGGLFFPWSITCHDRETGISCQSKILVESRKSTFAHKTLIAVRLSGFWGHENIVDRPNYSAGRSAGRER